MSDISKIDKNFKIESTVERAGVEFFNIDEAPFKIYGVYRENGIYRRMPEEVAKSVSEGVYGLHWHTAGGRVRFVTDSKFISINASLNNLGKMPHFPLTGSIGFDMYNGDTYVKTFVPPFDIEDGYESSFEFAESEKRCITINFPLYSGVTELYIGLDGGSLLEEAPEYANEKPIVYYGSSITQGGCASRPGTIYQAIISRHFNYDYINLGFSGSAKGEDEIIDYIKNLDMSMFVCDYDHNAPSVEHLKATHEKMFKAVRAVHPDIPIILMSRPQYRQIKEVKERRAVVESTYQNALASGDKNVYFIDGVALTELCGNDGTVDTCHPTDYGFASMAQAVIKVMKDIKI